MLQPLPSFVVDRRIAAFDETHTTQRRRGKDRDGVPRTGYLTVYAGNGNAHRRNLRSYLNRVRRTGNTDFHLSHPQRSYTDIRAVVLHLTAGCDFCNTRHRRILDNPTAHLDINSQSRLDQIAAHFVVRVDGTIFYTHDMRLIINSAAGRKGIDIEFAGNRETEFSTEAINNVRALIRWLKDNTGLSHIFPHGQITRNRRGKFHTCPGPNVWTNVGSHAIHFQGLSGESSELGYRDNGVSPVQLGRMTAQEYRQNAARMRIHRNRTRTRQRQLSRIIDRVSNTRRRRRR